MDKKALQKAKRLASQLGISKNKQNIFRLKSQDQSQEKQSQLLECLQGDFSKNEPWIIINESDELQVMFLAKTLTQFIKEHKKALKQNLELRLEKAIWQNVPVDFLDVWTVANTRLNQDKVPPDMDMDKLVKDIKRTHPNLFVNLKDMFKIGESDD